MSYERNQRWRGIFLLFLLGVLVLFPLLGTGFTTNDDAYYALQASGPWKTVFHVLHEESAGQGRFYKYLSVLFLLAPHVAQSFAFTACCNILAICLNIFLAALLVGRLLAPKWGMLFGVLFLALLQDHWGHSLLTAYPLGGQLGLVFCLLSWHALLSWRSLGGGKRLAASLGLFFLCLCCNELFVLFLIPGLLLCCMPMPAAAPKSRFLPAAIGLLSAVLLYVACYFTYKLIFPGAYSGTSVVMEDVSACFGVWKRFSLSALPLTTFFQERLALSRYAPYFSMDGSALLADRLLYQLANFKQWNPAWLAQAGLAGGLFFTLLRENNDAVSLKKLLWLAVFGLSLAAAPTALLGLSEKYRNWVREGVYAYAYTYHAYYGVCVLLTVFAALLCLLLRKTPRARTLALSLAALLLAGAAFLTAYANDSIVRTKQLAAQRWELADTLFASAPFRDLPDNARIAAPGLFRCFHILCPPEGYWSAYAAHRTGRQVAILDHLPEPAGKPLYFLELHQAFNTCAQFLALGNVRTLGTGEAVLSSEVALLVKARARKVRILCPVRPGAPPPVLQQQPMRRISCGLFAAEAVLDSAAEATLLRITGQDILLKELLVTDQFPYPALR